MALYLKNLKKFYRQGAVKAVDIQEMFVEKSRIACLIGPSGCGKTSVLRMINRLIEPDEGFVEINGLKSHEASPASWRRKIGYVIQKIGLLPHLTVLGNISLLSSVLKRDKAFILKRARELLELVGLDPAKYENRWPAELSGGESQRAGIARALMEDPPLLLMDEPFGALDPISRASLRKEFIRLNQKLKKTILMVTHDVREAFEMGGKIFLMRRGSIVQEGREEDFRRNPANSFVASFLNNS